MLFEGGGKLHFRTLYIVYTYYLCRYWNKDSKSLDFDGMIEDLSNAPEDSVVILHAVAHNPTGKNYSIRYFTRPVS